PPPVAGDPRAARGPRGRAGPRPADAELVPVNPAGGGQAGRRRRAALAARRVVGTGGNPRGRFESPRPSGPRLGAWRTAEGGSAKAVPAGTARRPSQLGRHAGRGRGPRGRLPDRGGPPRRPGPRLGRGSGRPGRLGETAFVRGRKCGRRDRAAAVGVTGGLPTTGSPGRSSYIGRAGRVGPFLAGRGFRNL